MQFFKASCQLPVSSCQWGARGFLSAVVLLGLALAQAPAGVAHIQAPKAVRARAHAHVVAVFTVAIDPGFHIQSNHPKLDYLIPSSLAIPAADGISVTHVSWPAAQDHKFSFASDPLAVFEGGFKLPVTLATGPAGEHQLHGTFRYQACNDQLCRPPVTEAFTLTVDVR